VFLGASHATRLWKAAIQFIQENKVERVKLYNNTRPGASLLGKNAPINYDLLASLTPNDFIIVQYTGNDLLEKRLLITHNPKIFHITEFVPKSDNNVRRSRLLLKRILGISSAKVIIIDDVYRHLRCCTLHMYPGLVKYFAKRNKELKEFFPQYEVLDHRRLLNVNFRKITTVHHYKDLLIDSVHLKPKHYLEIIQTLWAKYSI